MQKKYNYFVDDVQVSRNDFFAKLRKQCQRVAHTEVINGWCGVDFMELDEKKYKKCMRDINEGIDIFFLGDRAGKSFRRREA